eukprot:TRINITY_DN7814_c0_g1_i1.p1 TRINITY_DN7814_c0_g1~~TRINITY_DN7814_c0_g1_i1.p1  ORF type:complete len:251 (+),score=54.93 TRINITY_DN7814_c0_g1_i1:1-753(+)
MPPPQPPARVASPSSEVPSSSSLSNGPSARGPNNACCFCLNLRLGAIIIGLLSSFFNLLLFTWYSIAPSDFFHLQFSASLDLSLYTLFLLQLLVNILLIYGAFNRMPNHTVPWLIINAVVMIFILVLQILLLFFGYVRMSWSKNEYISALFVLGFVGACHLFCCFVVFQFRKNTVEELRLSANGSNGGALQPGQYSQPSAPPTYEEVSTKENTPAVKIQLEDETDEAPPDYDTAMQSKAVTQRLIKGGTD